MSDAGNPQTKRSPFPTEIWVGLLVIVGLTAVIFLRDAEQPKVSEPKQKSAPLLQKDIYSLLENKEIPQAIPILERYSKKAQKIIPFFPSFPKIWLMPPTEKGSFSSLGERHCIEFMELLFPGYHFPKVRPKWLENTKHETGRCLELDGYCEELSIAIEYNGIQHYVWPNFTNMTREEFIRQRERDQLKVEICISRNICLIRIPYTVPLERIPLAIYSKLLEGVPELEIEIQK